MRFLISLFVFLSYSALVITTVLASQQLRLFVLVPFFSEEEDTGWDRGIELLPAARIAVDEINQRSDLLKNYQLRITEASSNPCDVVPPNGALLNFVTDVVGVNGSINVIGVLGLACSTVTQTISPLAGRSEISLLQLSMANSPLFLDKSEYPLLWRILATTRSEALAVVALMNAVNWTTIATVSDDVGIFFTSTTIALKDEVRANGKNISVTLSVRENEGIIDNALMLLRSNGARVIFASVTIPEAALLLCRAANNGLVWPAYIWIFHSRTVREFVNDPPCELDILNNALDSVILIDWHLQQQDPKTILVSGKTFIEFRQEYSQRLNDLVEELKYQQYASKVVHDNVYANAMYDEVWAFALALNSSLEMEASNSTLSEHGLGNRHVATSIENQLSSLSFNGASGYITFDASSREAQTLVNIMQVKNGTEELIGVYYAENDTIHFNMSTDGFPSDEFEIHYNTLPISISIIGYLLDFITVALVTVVLVLVLALSKTSQIMAISPWLSTIMFFGCYMLVVSNLILDLQRTLTASLSEEIASALCFLSFYFQFEGLILVTSLMLLKLVRIYRIFTHFGKLGKLYSDWSLFAVLLVMTLPTKLSIVVLVTIDPVVSSLEIESYPTAIPPFVEHHYTCHSTFLHTFILMLLVYYLILASGVVLFGFQTRKISRHQFKDTKIVITYSFVATFVCGVSLPLYALLDSVSHIFQTISIVIILVGNTAIVWIILMVVFLPKVVSATHQKMQWRKSCSLTEPSTPTTAKTFENELWRL